MSEGLPAPPSPRTSASLSSCQSLQLNSMHTHTHTHTHTHNTCTHTHTHSQVISWMSSYTTGAQLIKQATGCTSVQNIQYITLPTVVLLLLITIQSNSAGDLIHTYSAVISNKQVLCFLKEGLYNEDHELAVCRFTTYKGMIYRLPGVI